uniref:Gamma-butyrobetaine hydroxylase-like N-terminal domain-containing protein n=1 Tax=Cucumis sativus TaxID=3659 RepID=A0A0A0LB75_CUCSA
MHVVERGMFARNGGKYTKLGKRVRYCTDTIAFAQLCGTVLMELDEVKDSKVDPRVSQGSSRHVLSCILQNFGKVEVKFADGSVFNLSAEFLRVYSPAADAKIRSIGGEKVISGRRHVGIMSAEPVGNYGVRILFDDLHRTGIYSWDYFFHLGSNKFTLLRNYVKTLKKHGLSRDPPKRK